MAAVALACCLAALAGVLLGQIRGDFQAMGQRDAPEADATTGLYFSLNDMDAQVANVLLVGERRKRCSQADTTQWLAYLAGLPVVLDGETELRAWSDTLNLARQYGLSAYDASYLELALREGIPLATLDAPLDRAARAAGVSIYQP